MLKTSLITYCIQAKTQILTKSNVSLLGSIIYMYGVICTIYILSTALYLYDSWT